jgi:hypothetical protein
VEQATVISQIIISLTINRLPSTAQHDKMVSLVERMLELHKQSAVVRSPQDKECAGREIRSTDEAIERLVYELSRKEMIYWLTEEEINIIYGKVQLCRTRLNTIHNSESQK